MLAYPHRMCRTSDRQTPRRMAQSIQEIRQTLGPRSLLKFKTLRIDRKDSHSKCVRLQILSGYIANLRE